MFPSVVPLGGAGYLCIPHPFATGIRRFPFDLHVLGTPPAFILSQDQTLHCLSMEPSFGSCLLLACFISECFLTHLFDVFLFSFQCSGHSALAECSLILSSPLLFVKHFFHIFYKNLTSSLSAPLSCRRERSPCAMGSCPPSHGHRFSLSMMSGKDARYSHLSCEQRAPPAAVHM